MAYNNDWMFSVRIDYEKSGRTFSLDMNKAYTITLDTCSWAPFGGLHLLIDGSDGTRSASVAIGFKKFVDTFFDSVERLCNLAIEYPVDVNDREQELVDRNRFLREAGEQYPPLLMHLARKFRVLSDQCERASVRISSFRP